MSNTNRIVKKSCVKESPTVFWTPRPSSATLENSSATVTPTHIREWLTSLPADSHVNRSASPENALPKTTHVTCGQPQGTLFRLSDHDKFCLKTCQGFATICPWSFQTCVDLGMLFDDLLSLGRTTLARTTDGNEYGYLHMWKTPTAEDCQNRKFARNSRGGTEIKRTGENLSNTTEQRLQGPTQGKFRIIHKKETETARRESCGTSSKNGGTWWTVEPAVGRVANGVARRADRLKSIGNGQVPLCMAYAYEILSSGIVE